MSAPSLTLLGGFRLYGTDGAALPLTARKAQALLSYLALQPGRRCARDRLAGLLWEGSTTAHARQSLRQLLTDLRRALPRDPPVLETTADEVRLVAGALEVDVEAFERLLDEDTPQALARAVDLYRGRLLEGLDARAPAFEDWLMTERSRLHERALAALQQLLEHERASDATARAIGRALHLLSLDPLRESAHRALMDLYARQGQYAAALRQYRICQRTLRHELDVAPEQETQRLFRRIMEHRQGATGEDVDGADEGTDTAAQAPTAEVRQAAVVLAEIDDSGDDPARSETPVAQGRPELEERIRSYGGRPLPHPGHAVLAVFGVPVAHSDDAERAVRTALAVRDALPRARIGVASGRVTVGPDEASTMTGAAVDQARDLAAGAAPGEIRLGARLHATVARRVDAEHVGGDEEPTWRLHALRPHGPVDRPAFVGRATELRQCAAALEACREIGCGQSLLVRGEAGIGKSRLLEECASLAERQGFSCHKVLVLDFGSRRDPVCALVHSLLGVASDAPEATARAVAERAVSAHLVDPARQGELYDLLGLPLPAALKAEFEAMDDTSRRERRQQLVAELVRTRAGQRPLLVMVEDIHWADGMTLDHLARIAAAVADCPALLLMTHRIEGQALDPAWRGAMQGAPLTTVDLGPLRAEEVRALAAELAAGDEALARRCAERAGGNPWFLEQLLQSGAVDEDAIPDSVRSLVHARLDGLEAIDRRAAGGAAVLGQRFPAAALQHLLDERGYDATALLANRVLQADGDDYRFSHDLIREGIYESLPASERRRLHARAAGWFREHDPILTAQHLDRAGSAEAASAYRAAALAERRAYRYARARALLARGLELARDPGERQALLRPQAELAHETGDIDTAIDAYREAAELAADDEQRCAAWLGVAAGYGVHDRHDDALAALQEAERYAGQRPQLRARLYTLQGNLLFPLGRIDDCLKAHQRARKHAREAGAAELEARALSGLGDAAYLRGRMITAGGHFERCVSLAHTEGLARIEAANLPMRGLTRFYANELDAARKDISEAVELAARIAHTRAETVARDALVTVLCYLGEWRAAQQEAERCLELARQLGAQRFEAESLMYLGLVRLGQERRSDAERVLHDAYACSRDASLPYVGPWILAALAAATGDPGKRERALAEGEALLAESSVSHNHLHFYQLAIEVALEDGDETGARRYCEALEAYTAAERLPWSEFFIARGRALAAWNAGQRNDALRQELQQLADQAEAVGLQPALPALRNALAQA